MKKTYKIIVFLIIVLIALLAVPFLQKKYSSNSTYPSYTPAPSSESKTETQNLIADERFILAPPPAEASSAAKKKHAAIVAKLAVKGNSIEINNCNPTPLVLEIKQGSTLTIKNGDNVSHQFMFDEEHSLNVKAQSESTISAKFKYGTGDYGYICKGTGLVGFLHIVP